ncbi:carboxymuconolactone decarboxylase family protein [Corynebacterium qintianiae]|uniref:carboxymuconolactone decarboxylase family protein n=1 Tax=Corynebacterium qintianiae TaxID=2709392 RepID=UPI001F41F59C|nr:carboxymuconolactone decarboxylase family protein [Corynebacterium qintianiae]
MEYHSARPGPGRDRDIAMLARLANHIGGRVQGTKTLNLFGAIGRARRNFLPWLLYSGSLMPFGMLPRKESELVILRVATLRDADYELEHHKVMGKRFGLTDADIAAVQEPVHGFTGRTGAVLDAVDDLVHHRQITDGVWTSLNSHLNDGEITALLLLVTNYDGLATIMDVLDVPLDEPR